MFSHFALRFVAIMALMISSSVGQDDWVDAQATFYGDEKGHGTQESTCGYDISKQGYGLEITALSTTLFGDGAICGACFEIKCVNSQWCIEDGPSIGVTTTSSCPNSTSTLNGGSKFCNPPTKHFYLPQPMFLKFALKYSGVIPIQYRRVACARDGGVKFRMGGNQTSMLVLVFNVQISGSIAKMEVKGSSPTWVQMTRDWGTANWQAGENWVGQSLSFHLTDSYNRTLELENVVPSNWQFGQTFEGTLNFH